MIWEIYRKELLNNFQSFRFLAMLIVTIFLFVVNPFLVSTDYSKRLQDYNHNIQETKKGDKTFLTAIFKRPNPLSFVTEGGDKQSTNHIVVSLDLGIMPIYTYSENVTFPSFQTIDWNFIFKVLFSLFAILLTFDSISGEKERGTLALISSNNVLKSSIILGKYIGALITVIIPAVMGMLISVIIVNLMGNTSLNKETISRLGLILAMSLVYISLFILLGIFISSIVQRSSVSLLLSLSVWIFLVIVVPNLAGVIAESNMKSLSEHEFAKKDFGTFDVFRDWKKYTAKKDFKSKEEASEELAKLLNAQSDERMKLADSYRNTIYAKEDQAINISRISPASEFEFASSEMVDSGIMSQRRFFESARKFYDIYADYKQQKTGKIQKYPNFPPMFRVKVQGQEAMIGPPPKVPLPKDDPDFPSAPIANLSVGESIASSLWNLALLLLWNTTLFLASYLYFLKYDVR